VHGLKIAVSDAPGPVVDVMIPPDAYNRGTRVGWKVSGGGRKWAYVNKSAAPPNGIVQVVLQDKSATAPGLEQFFVKGKRGAYAATTAVVPALVLPGAARCFAASFPGPAPTPVCGFNASGTTLHCK
jgi:hypothetical protein